MSDMEPGGLFYDFRDWSVEQARQAPGTDPEVVEIFSMALTAVANGHVRLGRFILITPGRPVEWAFFDTLVELQYVVDLLIHESVLGITIPMEPAVDFYAHWLAEDVKPPPVSRDVAAMVSALKGAALGQLGLRLPPSKALVATRLVGAAMAEAVIMERAERPLLLLYLYGESLIPGWAWVDDDDEAAAHVDQYERIEVLARVEIDWSEI